MFVAKKFTPLTVSNIKYERSQSVNNYTLLLMYSWHFWNSILLLEFFFGNFFAISAFVDF